MQNVGAAGDSAQPLVSSLLAETQPANEGVRDGRGAESRGVRFYFRRQHFISAKVAKVN